MFAPKEFRQVIIIDDSDVDLYIVKRIFNSTKFSKEVIDFNCGQKALNYLSECTLNSVRFPDLIFVDINMPMMDGFDFAKTFSGQYGSHADGCKIILVSSTLTKEVLERVKKEKYIFKLLEKPITPDDLSAISRDCKDRF